MKTLQISSIPLLNMLQKACEILVVHNIAASSIEPDSSKQSALEKEAAEAEKMVSHIRDLIKENESGASNPKS